MSFYTLFNTSATFPKMDHGKFGMLNRLNLRLAAIEKKKISEAGYDGTREEAIAAPSGKTSTLANEITDELGFEIDHRAPTNTLAEGTIYGRNGTWRALGRENTTSGLNPLSLNESGAIDHKWLRAQIRELNPYDENREARLNSFTTSWLTSVCYDNATALLLALGQRLVIARAAELAGTKVVRLVILESEYKANGLATLQNMVNHISEKLPTLFNGGIDIANHDDLISHLAKLLITKFKKLPPLTEAEPKRAAYEDVRYFECNEFDDGHSRSGPTFGDVYGFSRNRALVPLKAFFAQYGDESVFKDEGYLSVQDNEHEQLFFNARGHVNLGTLTRSEIVFLDSVIRGNTRQSPLMVDQTFSLLPEGSYLMAYNSTTTRIEDEAVVTSTLIRSVIRKLVNNHNWYEDARTANLLLQQWSAQPATESVESHWWPSLERDLRVPTLGLGRAAIPGLIGKYGVNVSKQALIEGQDLYGDDDSKFVKGLIFNTLWYWGEYLTIMNSSTMKQLADKLRFGGKEWLSEQDRSYAMISAISGMAVDAPASNISSTSIVGGIESQLRNRVSFGYIDTSSIVRHGYSVSGSSLTYNRLVQPGSTCLIVGLNGTLIRSTPYSSVFCLGAASSVDVKWRTTMAYTYNDMWALGVVARWQGYDVDYRLPDQSETSNRLHAANDSSVAYPPLVPTLAQRRGFYPIVDIKPRKRCFGTDTASLHTYKRTYVWTRDTPTALEQCRLDARLVGSEPPSAAHALMVDSTTIATTSKKYYIRSDYDLSMSGFHVTELATAITLPDATVALESTRLESIDDLPVDQHEN
ncbi:capsid protein [Red clover powdery mildew-associated totivirus 6]|uniref:Capsid protein n=1 Tax=Red clover powdery mildew-associated totivirus 6 TaxID=1714367 RepID=A0A0S3Q2B4_9VIRU|nr:capsid protein [Red clover powdery mildew-associated totivirus 6]BAT62487.1 capsid protein [Red clover powdery mildew-associated totivirus 6]